LIGLGNQKKCYDQTKEYNTQDNGDAKQRALNAAAGSKDTAGIGARQAAQACALALYDDAEDQQDGDYNQRDI